jgi:DNA-binding CsgD family transcriptional regulator
MSPVGITEQDVQQMLAITRDYQHDVPSQVLPEELLHDLWQLVPCDMVSVSGQDTPRWEFFADQEYSGMTVSAAQGDALDSAYREHYWDASCSYPDRTGDLTTIARSADRVADSSPHGDSGMLEDYLRPLGFEHDIVVCLPAGAPQRTLRVLFFRGPGSDFSDRDIAVLTLLRPHLQAAYITAERRRNGLVPLTPRQREILQCVEAGYTNRQIARRLFVAEGTVAKHLENVFQRLGVSSRTAAIAKLRAQA